MSEKPMKHSIVKDLVWNHFDVRGKFDLIGVWDANSIIGTFTIDKNGQKFIASLGSLGTLGLPVASLDEAKAIAFDYLQKEVLSTLDLPAYRREVLEKAAVLVEDEFIGGDTIAASIRALADKGAE